MEEVKERNVVLEKNKWKIEKLYFDLNAWEKDLQENYIESRPHWPHLAAFKGRLKEGAHVLKELFTLCFTLDRKLSKLHAYAHMRHDEDLSQEDYKKAYGKILSIYYEFGQEISWVEPEILALPASTIEAYLQNPSLEEYQFHLEKIVRLKPHTLTTDQEELLALSGKALNAPALAFSAFNDADLKFPKVENDKGEHLELTHSKYSMYMRSLDRKLRKNAFCAMYNAFFQFENTVTELLAGHIQQHVFNMRARKYGSCLEAALFPNQIDPQVYKNLTQTVRSNLPVLHQYMKLRKKLLKVEALHMYDLHVPLIDKVDLKYEYDQVEEMVIKAAAPLGEEYQRVLSNGLKKEGWVDRYENKRKRSGAYSSGTYDSMPYILMNFHGSFQDLMTLAHEAGHSMHSHLTHTTQTYQYSNTPIFLAEVASTFNEELMFDYLMKQKLSPLEKAFLINQKIEDIRNTFFRQTMFAEFELLLHTFAENNVPLTPGLLKEHYHKLNQDYFGPDVIIDQEIDIEWARIPHFYSNFYVYQYATGISAAHALFEQVSESGPKAYLTFLSSGSAKYPLDLLKLAGVNMLKQQPILATIKHFEHLVRELSNLV